MASGEKKREGPFQDLREGKFMNFFVGKSWGARVLWGLLKKPIRANGLKIGFKNPVPLGPKREWGGAYFSRGNPKRFWRKNPTTAERI